MYFYYMYNVHNIVYDTSGVAAVSDLFQSQTEKRSPRSQSPLQSFWMGTSNRGHLYIHAHVRYIYSCIHVQPSQLSCNHLYMYIIIYTIHVHVLMRDEKEGRKKQAYIHVVLKGIGSRYKQCLLLFLVH